MNGITFEQIDFSKCKDYNFYENRRDETLDYSIEIENNLDRDNENNFDRDGENDWIIVGFNIISRAIYYLKLKEDVEHIDDIQDIWLNIYTNILQNSALSKNEFRAVKDYFLNLKSYQEDNLSEKFQSSLKRIIILEDYFKNKSQNVLDIFPNLHDCKNIDKDLLIHTIISNIKYFINLIEKFKAKAKIFDDKFIDQIIRIYDYYNNTFNE